MHSQEWWRYEKGCAGMHVHVCALQPFALLQYTYMYCIQENLLRSFTTVFQGVVFACRVRRTPRPGEPQKVAPCCASSASGYLMMDSRLTMISFGRGEKIIGCHDHLDKHTTLHHPALCAAFHHLDSYQIGS